MALRHDTRAPMQAAPSPWAGWWMVWVVFVVYGSLLPFDFHPLPLAQAWAAFGRIPYLQLGVASRADWVANGVLYLPVGALAVLWLIGALGGRPRWLAVLLAIGLGTALAVAVEFAQLYFPPRTVSQNDLIAEVIGSVLGALAGPFIRPWLRRVAAGWHGGGATLLARALEAWALGVLALSFFPYDLLLDAAEWRNKLDSDLVGAWLAGPARERGWIGGLLLGVEVLISLPFGVLLTRHRRTVPWAAAALSGLALGLLIEGGQLAMASGVSQGASVLTRVLGVLVGAWCGARGWRVLAAARRLTRRHGMALQLGHAGLVLAASGVIGQPWRSAAQVSGQWASQHWMPLYYHYFTTEAEAVFSLGSVALMYAPIAWMGWALRRPARQDLWLAAGLAAGVEAAKLFIDGRHPDPTNLFIAVGVCALLRGALRRASALPPAAAPPLRAEPAARGVLAVGVAGLAVGAALLQALAFPAAALPLAMLLALAAGLVWWRPAWSLVILPAAMPVLDLAPWSGRLLWDEFDLLQMVVLAVAWARVRPAAGAPASRASPAWALLLVLWGASLAISLLRGGSPWAWPDANVWFSHFDPYNALRIAKGALGAWLLIALLPRLAGVETRWRLLGAGLCLGLAMTVAVVLWERVAFAGLADFSADYRVTGPFSAMHTGGATIECFIAMAAAVALSALVALRQRWLRAALLALLLLASYALMVTYSRNGWGALLAAAAVVMVAAARRTGPTAGRRLAALWPVLAMAAVALPVLFGGFAQQRLAHTGQDFNVRLAHWRDALALRGDDLASLALGEGLGRFPALHYWRSSETPHAGMFSVETGADGPFLRLGTGAAVYVEQFVAVGGGQHLRLSLKLRAAPGSALGIALCEKWMLTSARCAQLTPGPRQAAGAWQRAEWPLDTSGWQPGATALPRPVKLALFHAGGAGAIDVADVQLTTADGRPLLSNGNFAQGLDHWFYSTDVDPPWHIHSLPVTVLLEQGWLGLLSWTLVLAAAGIGAARRAWRGDLGAAGLLAALVAFTVSGSVNTLVDTPRMLWLIWLLVGVAANLPARQDVQLLRSRPGLPPG